MPHQGQRQGGQPRRDPGQGDVQAAGPVAVLRVTAQPGAVKHEQQRRAEAQHRDPEQHREQVTGAQHEAAGEIVEPGPLVVRAVIQRPGVEGPGGAAGQGVAVVHAPAHQQGVHAPELALHADQPEQQPAAQQQSQQRARQAAQPAEQQRHQQCRQRHRQPPGQRAAARRQPVDKALMALLAGQPKRPASVATAQGEHEQNNE